MSFVIPSNVRSWVPGADGSEFPIQNMPYGRVYSDDGDEINAIRIGDFALSLDRLYELDLLPADVSMPDPLIVMLMAGRPGLTELRAALYEHLRADAVQTEDRRRAIESALIPLDEVDVELPVQVGAFVDFYSGIHHASNVGRMFRPDMPPLLPNYKWIPIAYNGRASSVVVSGTPIARPSGQRKAPDAEAPEFGPTRELDFELELGVITGAVTPMGTPIRLEDMDEVMFGVVLVNDWSARDVQRWEYQPLGPFLAKTFATSISPWAVPLDALEPFRVAGMPQDPEPLAYLREEGLRAYDIELEVFLQTARANRPQRISATNARELYWSFRQQLAHQASNGTPLMAGDLYATGTISGPEKGTFGSLLELTWRGSEPITIEETGEKRTFLEDGDTIIMRGVARNEELTIGLGEVSGTVLSELNV